MSVSPRPGETPTPWETPTNPEVSESMPPVRYRSDGFPPEDRLDWRRLAPLMGPAAAAAARYDCLLATIPNPRALLAGLRVREAVCSSRIENIFASVTEVLEMNAGLVPANPYARAGAREVLNYLAAERHAKKMLAELPLSLRVIREAHAPLLAGDRGQGKSPGAFRRAPVWIGAPGSTPETATFVPAPASQVLDAMSAWERYIHADVPDRLVQIAVQHARFAHSDDADHRFRQADRRFQAMPITLVGRRSVRGAEGRV